MISNTGTSEVQEFLLVYKEEHDRLVQAILDQLRVSYDKSSGETREMCGSEGFIDRVVRISNVSQLLGLIDLAKSPITIGTDCERPGMTAIFIPNIQSTWL